MRNSHQPDMETNPARSSLPPKRQALVSRMAISMIAVGSILFPAALYAAFQGEFVPLLLSILVFGVSIFSIVSAVRGQSGSKSNATMSVELSALVLGGLILSVADPAWFDPGFSIILLAPVHYALARGKASEKKLGLVLVALALFGGVSVGGWIPSLMVSGTILGWTGAIYCACIILVQMYTAHRLFQFGHARDRAHNVAVRQLAEQMGDGFVRISGKGNVLFASDLTKKMLGATQFELAGQGIVDRVHVLDRPKFLQSQSDSIHKSKNKIVEVRVRRDNPKTVSSVPEYIWVEVYFSPIADLFETRENWEIIALLRNITNRKDHEFGLIESKKKAEQASQTKSGFLATIGHELRTPLNAIVGFSEMMTNGIGGKLDPGHEEYADLIFQSGHHLLDTVNMLLDMSKIEAGKFELQLNSFEPIDIVRPCIQMIETTARDKNVALITQVSGELPTIVGDERAGRQILINLLSNAVKFSESGGKVTVSAKRQGQKLNITVTDTGIGMSQEVAARVGEAFFQAQDGLSRQFEGTGLGLSIVKGLVELHEGSMHINSELGTGTSITILLPIHGPQTNFVEPHIVTPMLKLSNKTQPGQEPEPKRLAV